MSTAPEPYAEFLATKGYEKYAGFVIAGLPTWGDTVSEVRFLTELDLELLAEHEVDTTEHPGIIPIARVGKEAGANAFLAINATVAACPVLLWDEGQFHPVAASFGAFLKKLKKKTSDRKSASYYNGIYRTLHSANKEENYTGALAVLEGPARIGPPQPKERADLAKAVSNMFNAGGLARSSLPNQDPVPDYEMAIAWAKAGKVTPKYAYLNLIDWYALTSGHYPEAIARAEEFLALEPDDDDVEFYCRKAIGFSFLALGDEAKAHAAYGQVHRRFAKDKEKRDEVLEDLAKPAASSKSKALAKALVASFKSGRWNEPGGK